MSTTLQRQTCQNHNRSLLNNILLLFYTNQNTCILILFNPTPCLIPPRSPTAVYQFCVLFFNNPRSANFVAHVFQIGIIHWRGVDLPGGIPLKKNGSLSPKSH